MTRRKKIFLRVGGIMFLLLGVGVALWVRHFHRYTPREVMLDVRAGIASRHSQEPVKEFLAHRYGPLTEAENRQKAFCEFFNVGHIQGMHLLVKRMPDSMREPSIKGMARWVSEYRQTMTPEEKQALREYFNTPVGRKSIKEATAQYLSHDVYYRGATAGVITELMTTLTEIEKP